MTTSSRLQYPLVLCVLSFHIKPFFLYTSEYQTHVVVVLTLTRIIKFVVTGQAPVTLELRNTLWKNTNNPRWYTHISPLTQFMPPPETYKSEIGSQSAMCQVHAGAFVSSLAPGKNEKTDYTACYPRKTINTTYTCDDFSTPSSVRADSSS